MVFDTPGLQVRGALRHGADLAHIVPQLVPQARGPEGRLRALVVQRAGEPVGRVRGLGVSALLQATAPRQLRAGARASSRKLA
ncbi:hypothetical protein ACLESD_25915, partial [Pyxidicoccus sp. 3LFB2]